MSKAWLVPLVTLVLSLGAEISFSAIVHYDDRPAWRSAVHGAPRVVEDFESYSSDVFYGPSNPVSLKAGLSVSRADDLFSSRSKIDVPPVDSEIGVDGSAALGFVTGRSPFLTFEFPVSAFGADFASFNDNFDRSRIELYSGEELAGIIQPSVTFMPRFIGFAADAGELISEIRFVELVSANDNFGIDNIEFVVPEPNGVLLGTLALVPFSCCTIMFRDRSMSR